MTKKQLKVLEGFAGIRATSEALNRIGIDHETTTVEFDKKVQGVSNKLWETNEPTRDITKILDPEYEHNLLNRQFDMFVGGFPCQPFSNAGKGQGFHDEKGRGTLYIDTLNVIKHFQPDFVILENVNAITQAKHKWIVDEIETTLKELGYFVNIQMINAKSFIPQNRPRLFIMASKLKQPKDIKDGNNNLMLKDFLEKEVSVNYDITQNQIENLNLNLNNLTLEDADKIIKVGNCSSTNHNALNVYSVKGISSTFRGNHGASIKIIYELESDFYYDYNKADKNGDKKWLNAKNYIGPESKNFPGSTDGTNRFYKDTSTHKGALLASSPGKIVEGWKKEFEDKDIKELFDKKIIRIRSITQREAFRLQGWKDEQIDKIINLPKSNLYHVAGNSMAIPVMQAIVKELLNV